MLMIHKMQEQRFLMFPSSIIVIDQVLIRCWLQRSTRRRTESSAPTTTQWLISLERCFSYVFYSFSSYPYIIETMKLCMGRMSVIFGKNVIKEKKENKHQIKLTLGK